MWATIAGLAVAAAMPLLWPASLPWIERFTPLLSLFFFLAAVGHWLRMGSRAFPVAAFLVILIYALTALPPVSYGLGDFYIVALLSSLLVFALAGFNMVFILEEAVFDVHRLLHVAHPAWRYVPTAVSLALAIGIPLVAWPMGHRLPWLWGASVAGAGLLLGWWFVAAINGLEGQRVLREVHLLVAGGLAIGALGDFVTSVASLPGIFPSVLAYFVLFGTWLYVSYTTLQRTHFLLAAGNSIPWLLLLLSASFALLQHAHLHYSVEGRTGVAILLNQRLAYFIVGIGVGLGFYVVQSLWRLLRYFRDDRTASPRSRVVAGKLARVAEGILEAEHRLLEGTALTVLGGAEGFLPGRHHKPTAPKWEVDSQTGVVSEINDEEE